MTADPKTDFERVLADEVVERFVERCRHLWPGCRVIEIRRVNSKPSDK
jgi:hypothetical protein